MTGRHFYATGIPLKHKTYNCEVAFARYVYKASFPCMMLYDAMTYEPVMTMTTLIPDHEYLEPGTFTIKDWSENAGILESLVSAGLAEDTGKTIKTGFVAAPIMRAKGELLEAVIRSGYWTELKANRPADHEPRINP